MRFKIIYFLRVFALNKVKVIVKQREKKKFFTRLIHLVIFNLYTEDFMLIFIMICSAYSIKSFEDSYSRKSQYITKKKNSR
jgi:hypothetical protein